MRGNRRRRRSAVRLREDRRIRAALAVAAFVAVTVVACLIAYPRMFTGFGPYDDEGYMLITLKGFIAHGSLYDRTFSQYGPFYSEFWGGLFSLLGIPVDHDAGRIVTLVVWILSSLTLGLATARMTGSVLLGLAVQMLGFSALGALTNEPMHPGGIVCLLLAAIVAVACCVQERAAPRATAVLGAAVAALLLVKVNVGAFALVSLALACVVGYPALVGRRWLRPAIELAFVAVPWLVMLRELGEPWVRQYAFHVSVAALAVVVVLRVRERPRRSAEELRWLLCGFLAVIAVVIAAILATGTTPGGLFDGVVRQPLHQTRAFVLPLAMPRRFYAVDLIALCGAVAYAYASRRRKRPSVGVWSVASALLTALVGMAMAISVSGDAFRFDPGGYRGYPFAMLGFCWVALIAVPSDGRSGVAFVRLLLPLLAVLQALHAFPVAGSQILWSSFLLIPVGAVCVADGVRGLVGTSEPYARRRALVALVGVGAVLATWFVVDGTLRRPLHDSRAAYRASTPLGLPGAAAVRVGAPEAELYRLVAGAIRGNCPAFVMLPGMNSFYLWAQQEPPTGENATTWPTLFDDARQQRVIAETRSIKGLCVLENSQLLGFWNVGAMRPTPLIRYMRRGFRPIVTFGAYTLLKREGTGA